MYTELAKINSFYIEKLAEATRKFAALKIELSISNDNHRNGRKKSKVAIGEASIPVRKLKVLKLVLTEFYFSLVLLQNYQALNATGFRKILKKHDKKLGSENGANFWREFVEVAHFHTNKDVDKLLKETESIYIVEIEGGDRQRAMKRLRVPPLSEQTSPWIAFKVGLFSGAFIILFIAVILSGIFHKTYDNHSTETWKVAFRLYRSPLLIILFMFFMGLNVYGWRSAGVNHILIFELDPRNHLSAQQLMELSALLGITWTLSVLSFTFSDKLFYSIPAYANPLAFNCLMLLFFINPTDTFWRPARLWSLRELGMIFCAPFFAVAFADFWLADQLNSLAPVFADLHYLVCFYVTPNATVNNDWQVASDPSLCVGPSHWERPLLICLPAWFRFAQCLRRYRDTGEAFPHLVNAGKYSTTFLVVAFSHMNAVYADKNDDDIIGNPYFYAWIVFSLISSIYAYVWDVKMDWGLLRKSAPKENRFLREEIVYSSVWFYYFGIFEDLLLRFGWIITVSLTEAVSVLPGDLMTIVSALLEVFRRFVWNFFRLENEHLNNCGKFRAVRDISVAPIHIDVLEEISLSRVEEEDERFQHQ